MVLPIEELGSNFNPKVNKQDARAEIASRFALPRQCPRNLVPTPLRKAVHPRVLALQPLAIVPSSVRVTPSTNLVIQVQQYISINWVLAPLQVN